MAASAGAGPDRLNDKAPTRIAISLLILFLASVLSWLLRLAAKRNSATAQVLTLEDAILWVDWIINATVAFSVLAIKGDGGDVTTSEVGLLLGVIIVVSLIIPNYLRWYGTDSAGNYHTYRGIVASNVMALAVVVVTIAAGATFF
ncbi:hypothetical protein [Frankia gtarii]|uniref:hypothetical protein n=1 Tax=Frankia gtarii TaxID=2950102 RepID=UPI0021BF3066|nr:hypothetical protein [Frankia gtarii]